MWAILYSEAIPFRLEFNVRWGGSSTPNEKRALPEPVEVDKSGQEHPDDRYDPYTDPENMDRLQDIAPDDYMVGGDVTTSRPSWRDLQPELPDRERPDMDRDMSDWLDPYNTPEEESRLPDRYGWDQYDTGYYYQ